MESRESPIAARTASVSVRKLIEETVWLGDNPVATLADSRANQRRYGILRAQ
jgi:hypothetical protein